MQTLIRLQRIALLVILAVALTATGFAHRMPSPGGEAETQAQSEALAFALANGASLADFCGDNLPGGAGKTPHCLACQIAGSADLPVTVATLIDADLAFVARVIAPRESRALARVLDPANAPQGPPVA